MAIHHKIDEPSEWLTPAEVAALYRVDSKTVTRWAKSGAIPAEDVIRTLGGPDGNGHRRYRRSFFEQHLNGRKP